MPLHLSLPPKNYLVCALLLMIAKESNAAALRSLKDAMMHFTYRIFYIKTHSIPDMVF